MRVLYLLLATGCAQEQYGECSPPDDHLKLMFKPAIKGHPFGHSFCVVCNPELEPEEYETWALDMGATQSPASVEDVYPCLYVYSGSSDIDSFSECENLVCGGSAQYNDMVGTENANFDLNPIVQ